jgi:hypothetical protein
LTGACTRAKISSIRIEYDDAIIESRKQAVRDVWAYRPVEHIPIMLSVAGNPWGYSVKDQLFDAEKQLAVCVRGVKLSLERVPDDYIPNAFVNVGCNAIPSAFGCELAYGDHPDQTPAVKAPILFSPADVFALERPDPRRDGLLPDFLARIRRFIDATEGRVFLSCLDMNGPAGIASDLLGSSLYFSMMYDAPDALCHLLGFLAHVIVDVTDAVIETAGGIDRLSSTDFFWDWCPEGKKGHVSDDLSACVSPEFFRTFSIPANSVIYNTFGPGLLHNCGPNPCVREYLAHDPPIAGVNIAYEYSIRDLAAFREPFARRGIIYTAFTGSPTEAAAKYRGVMDTLAPDVIVIPQLSVGEKDDAAAYYSAMLEVSREYAERMWGQ